MRFSDDGRSEKDWVWWAERERGGVFIGYERLREFCWWIGKTRFKDVEKGLGLLSAGNRTPYPWAAVLVWFNGCKSNVPFLGVSEKNDHFNFSWIHCPFFFLTRRWLQKALLEFVAHEREDFLTQRKIVLIFRIPLYVLFCTVPFSHEREEKLNKFLLLRGSKNAGFLLSLKIEIRGVWNPFNCTKMTSEESSLRGKRRKNIAVKIFVGNIYHFFL